MDVMRTKSVERSIRETDEPEHKLKKSLGTLDLIVFGVGVIIGAGIFVITGTVAATNSGPAITISFAIAGLACALAALCYAEFASTVPVAGSAYTFSYATFGELVAWIIGWDLALEFTIGSAALATSFSGYLQTVLDGTPFEIPASIGSAAGGVIDLPAVIISLLVMGVLIAGIRFSSVLNQIVVAIKLLVVATVILVGRHPDRPRQLHAVHPQVPARGRGQRRLHGPDPDQHAARHRPGGLRHGRGRRRRLDRVLRVHRLRHRGHHRRGDQEPAARHPARHPRLAGDRTVLYMAVSLVITGMQNYTDIDPNDGAPLSTAFDAVGMEWMGNLIAIGACIGLIVVVMILMLGQTRVGFAMARDGLLPVGWPRCTRSSALPTSSPRSPVSPSPSSAGWSTWRPWCTWSASARSSRSSW